MRAAKESTLAKPQTNTLRNSEWISLWNSKHDPVTGCMDSGSDWSLFIHKSWKESMRARHMEVFFLNQAHMVALFSTAAWHAQSWERQEALVLCAQQKLFFRHWYLMEGEEHGTIARASLHMEAITSNCALRLYPSRNEITEILIPASPLCPFPCY